jgi:hypothetical protein
MSFYLHKDGQQSGPFTVEELQEAIVNGTMTSADLIWKEGMSEWKPVVSIIPPTPPKVPTVPLGMPPLPIQQSDPFSGRGFLIAKLDDKSSKNSYDIINIETGKVAICIREAALSGGGTFARGALGGWGGGQAFSKFDITLSDLSGAVYIVVRGKGISGHADVFKPSGEKIGEIKRTSMFNLHFEAFAEEGILFKIISKGIGKLTFGQKLLDKNGHQLGNITDAGWSDAKKVLGDNIRLLDSDSLLRSKYTYKHQIELEKDLSSKEKCFLFGAMYQLAHVAGE